MKLVVISGYAYGYHSEAEHYEELVITKDLFDKAEKEIKDIEYYVYELDGKHSENQVDFEIDHISDETDICSYNFEENSKETLYEIIKGIFKDKGIKLDEDLEKVQEYISTLDKLVQVTVTVRESQIEQVINFADNLE